MISSRPPNAISDRVTNVIVGSGGTTFMLWIDYFDSCLKLLITIGGVILVSHQIYKTIINPPKKD